MIEINKSTIVIISLSLFLFLGYHVLTVEAAESDDKQVCEDYNGKWKSMGGGVRGCTFDNEQDRQLYTIRPGDSLDSTSSDAEYGREDLGEEETAAIEDDICDDEDADDTKIDICKSPKNVEDGYKGKRYVNPDGGAPLYADELTEEEKDDYTEYKPEKE